MTPDQRRALLEFENVDVWFEAMRDFGDRSPERKAWFHAAFGPLHHAYNQRRDELWRDDWDTLLSQDLVVIKDAVALVHDDWERRITTWRQRERERRQTQTRPENHCEVLVGGPGPTVTVRRAVPPRPPGHNYESAYNHTIDEAGDEWVYTWADLTDPGYGNLLCQLRWAGEITDAQHAELKHRGAGSSAPPVWDTAAPPVSYPSWARAIDALLLETPAPAACRKRTAAQAWAEDGGGPPPRPPRRPHGKDHRADGSTTTGTEEERWELEEEL